MNEPDSKTLIKLKELCQICSSPEEEKELLENLMRILQYVSQLDEISTENVSPCRFVLGSLQKRDMREDAVQDLMPREAFLMNAPQQIGGMIKIPSVLHDS